MLPRLVFAPRSLIGTNRSPGVLFPLLLAGFDATMSHPLPAAEALYAYRCKGAQKAPRHSA